MKYLTPEQVLFIHARLIAEMGGSHGIRDLGLLQSTIARPQATLHGQDLYPDIFSKAGVLKEQLCKIIPFWLAISPAFHLTRRTEYRVAVRYHRFSLTHFKETL